MTHGTVSAYTNNRCRCDPCRAAMRAYQTDWRKKNPERYRAIARRSKAKNREKSRRWREANPERIRANERLRVYGLTDEAYQALLTSQAGRCAICGNAGTLHVDHDHKTGAVRGLLCPRCNMGIGMMDEDLDRLAASIRYLSKPNLVLGRDPAANRLDEVKALTGLG
jgi:hypothetical protein